LEEALDLKEKSKLTLIFWQMKDDTNIFANGTTIWQMVDTLNL
jgi:hypothetical protein